MERENMTAPDPHPRRRWTPEERYKNDVTFKALVDYMEASIHHCQYTPSELREAAMLAAIHYEMHLTKRRNYSS